MHPRRFLSCLCIGGLLLTSGCDYWHDVTIPANDTTPPLAASRLVEFGGDFDQLSLGSPGINYEVDDPDRLFIPIAAAWDPEGAHRVTLHHGMTRNCQNGDIGALQNIHLASTTVEQPGAVGDVVDSGVWASYAIRMSDHTTCPGNTSLVSVSYWWATEAENYAGDIAHSSGGTLTYRP